MEFIAASRILEACAVLVLISYFPILTYSFFAYRLERKQKELMILVDKVKLQGNVTTEILEERMDKEYTRQDYYLPLFFVTVLTFFGMFLLFMGYVFYYKQDGSFSSPMFAGAAFWQNKELIVERRSVAVMAFAIMGSYISASQYIYRRFSTIDLTPGNFFSVGLRMVLSAVVSLMLSFVLTDTLVTDSDIILAIAFLSGIFPDTALRILIQKTKLFAQELKKEYKNYDLNQIEGISQMHKMRMSEIGIDNVQNLAHYNFLMLIIKTPFPVRMLMDWTAQAKLLTEFQEDYFKLKKAGIRSVMDYIDALENQPDRYEAIAQICDVNRLSLEINFQNIAKDQSVTLLMHFRENLESFHLE